MDAQVTRLLIIGDRGNGTTGSLKDERDEITGDEDDAIHSGLDPRKMGAVNLDDPGQTEVNGGRKKGGPNCQAD